MRAFAAAVWFLLCFPAHAAFADAERFALLVGVDDYAPPMPKLEGARNDATGLRDVLVSRWNFPRQHITLLLGADATHLGVINAMTSLMAQTKPDDIVFVYFAAHGTSASNRGLRVPLPHTTGAILPADFRFGDAKEMLETLIIGRRDIRPALEALDRGGRRVFVAIDACYSGNTVRGRDLAATGKPRLPVRNVELPQEGKLASMDAELGGSDSEYPYRNVVYLSAASENEAAGEISGDYLKFYPTHDGKPHGAFTDALIRALSDDLPTKAKGASYYQIHAAIRAFMEHAGYPQSPQLLPVPPKSGTWGAAASLFGTEGSQPSKETGASKTSSTLRVKFIGPAGPVLKTIGEIHGVEIVDVRPDLVVVKDPAAIRLLSAGGDLIATVADVNAQVVVQAIKQQVWLYGLTSQAGRQRSGLALEFGDNRLGATRRAGDTVGFRLTIDRPAYLVLLNVDPNGLTRVLYPAVASEVVRSPSGQVLELTGTEVVPPFGVESLVAFGISGEPAWLRDFAGKEMPEGSPEWRTFVSRILAPASDVSIAIMQTVTSQ